MTEDNFLKGMARIMLASNKKYDDDEMDIMFELLSDIPDKTFLAVCSNICNGEVQFFPGTNIIAMIRGKAEQISNPQISGAEAWEQVMVAASGGKGITGTVSRAYKALGVQWYLITPGGGFELSREKIGYVRRDFLRFFEEFSKADKNKKLNIESREGIDKHDANQIISNLSSTGMLEVKSIGK